MDLYNFIILFSPILLVVATLAFVAAMRYIAYKERVDLVERGVDIEALFRSQQLGKQGNRGILWAGSITASSGLGILLGLWMLGRGVWLIAGFLPFFVGLGMLAVYYVTRGAAAGNHSTGRPPSRDDAAATPARPPAS